MSVPPVHVALAGSLRELGDRLHQLADGIELGGHAEHMDPVRLLVLSGDTLTAARVLERETVILTGIVRVVYKIPVHAGGAAPCEP